MSRSAAPAGSGGRCRLLGVFAHPDDETFCAGGTFARYAGPGAEIMVVSATRGQAGQIRDAAVGDRRTIAAVREAELRLACERLGIAKVCCLDYVDSTPADAEFSTLAAEVSGTMRHIRDHVPVRWYPPGSYVVEQGEEAAELFLILSGAAAAWQESSAGHCRHLRRMGLLSWTRCRRGPYLTLPGTDCRYTTESLHHLDAMRNGGILDEDSRRVL